VFCLCDAFVSVQAAAVKATRAAMEQVSLPAALDMAPNGVEGVKAKVKIATPNPVSNHRHASHLASEPVCQLAVCRPAPSCHWRATLLCRKGWM
jgi:hypothetical protein